MREEIEAAVDRLKKSKASSVDNAIHTEHDIFFTNSVCLSNAGIVSKRWTYRHTSLTVW